MSDFRLWWKQPQLMQGSESKRVTWLELFFDLIFVVVISYLAHHLTAHPDLPDLLTFGLLFIPVWWTWIGITYYNERFETFDLSFRVFTFLQLLAVAGMAASAEEGLGRAATGFALSYASARALLAWMWFRAGRANPGSRPITTVFVLGFGTSALLWTAGAFLPGPLGFTLKMTGLLIDVLTPLVNYRAEVQTFTMHLRKLPERFGLFVIIVLGESLTGVVNGLSDARAASLATLVRFVLVMMLGFGLWWLYFDSAGRREPQTTASRVFAWAYLHLPLVLGIVMVSAMTTYAVTAGAVAVPPAVRWIMATGLALYQLASAALEFTLQADDVLASGLITPVRLAAAALALLVPLLPLPVTGMVAALVGLLLVQMIIGLNAWFGSDRVGQQDLH